MEEGEATEESLGQITQHLEALWASPLHEVSKLCGSLVCSYSYFKRARRGVRAMRWFVIVVVFQTRLQTCILTSMYLLIVYKTWWHCFLSIMFFVRGGAVYLQTQMLQPS